MEQRALKQPLPNGLKILITGIALPLLGFCVFGFLATFEPNPPAITWTFRIGYALASLVTLVFVSRLILKKGKSSDAK